MIKKLQTKLIIITMCSLAAVLAVIIGAINIAAYTRLNQEADAILTVLIENGGSFPKPGRPKLPFEAREMLPETPYESRYFTVTVSPEGSVTHSNVHSIAAITEEEAKALALKVYAGGTAAGFEGVYKYAVSRGQQGTLLVFLDRSRDLAVTGSFLLTSVLVSLAGLAAVFVLVLFFSRMAVKPVAESFEKQKRFITDASHEIKTPLTIIDANTEVLELSGVQNEWTGSIKKQVKRLTSLTESLVSLARLEENTPPDMTEFSFSDAVSESIAPFLAVAGRQEKRFALKIEENITLKGNEALIRQLVSLLADNALRYSSPQAVISVTLSSHGKQSLFTVSNPAPGLTKGSQPQLFERFYRADASRSQTAGYGIGLSIAQSIVTLHKGKIVAESPDGAQLVLSVFL